MGVTEGWTDTKKAGVYFGQTGRSMTGQTYLEKREGMD